MPNKQPLPPSTPPPPSVLLLLAVGDLQRDIGGEPVAYTDLIAVEMGITVVDVPPLVVRGVERGYLVEDDGVRLTAKGWAWYERHRDGG